MDPNPIPNLNTLILTPYPYPCPNQPGALVGPPGIYVACGGKLG